MEFIKKKILQKSKVLKLGFDNFFAHAEMCFQKISTSNLRYKEYFQKNQNHSKFVALIFVLFHLLKYFEKNNLKNIITQLV